MDKEFLAHLFDKGRIGDEFDKTFDELVRLGYLETAGMDERGEYRYKLTPKARLLFKLMPQDPDPLPPHSPAP